MWKTDSLVMSLSVILQHSEPGGHHTALVDLQLGPGAVLRGPPYVVEHSEGVSGLKSQGMKNSVIYFFTG